MSAAVTLAESVGPSRACSAMGVARASLHRSRRPRPTPAPRPTPPRALSPDERQAVLDVLNSERFADVAPPEIYAILLDEGIFLASVRTMYRILAEESESRERRDQLRHPAYTAPELLATRPNEVWSWDISKLLGPTKWTYFYLYVLLDIFSRYVVGWMVAHRESSRLAVRLIEDSLQKQGIVPGQLTVHADRGASMRSKPVAFLLADLGVTKTHSRPHVSNDNPYSESQFKTFKYRPEFPGRHGCIEHAHSVAGHLLGWYNNEHRHSGIGFMTPYAMHYGLAHGLRQQRQDVLLAAHAAHPERFVRRLPQPPALPTAAWINKPSGPGPDGALVLPHTLVL